MSRKLVQLVSHPEPLWVDPDGVAYVDSDRGYVAFAGGGGISPIMPAADVAERLGNLVQVDGLYVNLAQITCVVNEAEAKGDGAIVAFGNVRVLTSKSVDEWVEMIAPTERVEL